VATCARGTEPALAEELGALGLPEVAVDAGAVTFGGGLEAAYRVCLGSRVASRVLWPIARFEADDAQALYERVRDVAWEDHLSPDRTLAVRCVGGHSGLPDLRYAARKAKDAIVDRLRDRHGRRPDVDRHHPDVQVHVHLQGTEVSVAIDLSGEPLHRRGYRPRGAAAPLKETLAAAVLHLAGWPAAAARGAPLVDPLCGSGTLLVEAAAMARGMPPGLARARFGFEGWLGHVPGRWERVRAEARERAERTRGAPVEVHGHDVDAQALDLARESARRAGVADAVTVTRRDLAEAAPPGDTPGLVVTNPPYGERLGETSSLMPLYETLGDVLRRRFLGWEAHVLAGNRDLVRHLGLKPTRRHVLFNGPLECRLLTYPIAAAPVREGKGPRWRGRGPDAEMLENRLRKNLRKVRRWTRQEDTTCYRLYDRDIPEYNVIIDVYGDAVHIQERERPRKVDPLRAEEHLRDARLVVQELLGVDPGDVFLKVRRRQKGGAQYEKRSSQGAVRTVREQGLGFEVNLSDYLDTGLFLDERPLRAELRAQSAGARFLNLFAYTGSATVYAAAGGARATTSVDLSNTYLAWARRNLEHNGLWDPRRHALVRADVGEWLRQGRDAFDLVFAAPPRYSRSKAMRGDFDLARDQEALIGAIEPRVAPGGTLYFVGAGPLAPSVAQRFRQQQKTLVFRSRDA
jgi:23S rRNA (guanine2445-N2)-methyltransferase / 23S rRNA (guanine2069-N7)-methyltransferase